MDTARRGGAVLKATGTKAAENAAIGAVERTENRVTEENAAKVATDADRRASQFTMVLRGHGLNHQHFFCDGIVHVVMAALNFTISDAITRTI